MSERGHEPSGAGGGEHGQATVELVLTLPFVALALLLVVQVLLVAQGHLVVQHAAREGARVAAVDPDPTAARTAALGESLPPGRSSVGVDRLRTGLVRVVVEHRLPTVVPLVGRFLPDVELRGEATFRAEWIPP